MDNISYQRKVEQISSTVIEVSLAPGEDIADLRHVVLEWLQTKAGRPLSDAMLRGDSDSFDDLGTQRVETVALPDRLVWAARQDFQDPTIPQRTWVTEVMLGSREIGRVLLGFRLHCVTLGESAAFSRSIPRFMRDIARRFPTQLEGHDIDLRPRCVDTVEDADAFVDLLCDERRRMPVLAFAAADPGVTSAETDRVAADVVGAAHVRILSRAATFRVTDRLGRRLSAYNGAVRLWTTPVHEGCNVHDHPRWLPDQLEDPSLPIRELIVDRVLRHSAGRRDFDDALPSFAEARRIASTVARQTAASSGRSAEDLLPLYEAENVRLIEAAKVTLAECDDLLAQADEERAALLRERDDAQAEIFALRGRLDEMARSSCRQDAKPVFELPESLTDLEPWANQNLGVDVELLPRALRAAKKAEIDDVALAFRALLLLKTAYAPMRRGSGPAAREAWEAGLRQLGLSCSPTQDPSRAGEHASEYRVTYDGRLQWLDMHLKNGNSRDPRYCFRLYFFWSGERDRVVVGSLPQHLGNRIS